MPKTTIEQQLRASARFHRTWAKQVPGAGQLVMVARLMEEGASEIEALRQQVQTLIAENARSKDRGISNQTSDES